MTAKSWKFSSATSRRATAILLTASLLVPTASTLLSGCAGPAMKPAQRLAREREEEKAVQEIEMLHESGAYQTVLRWVDDFIDRYPKSTRRSRALFVKGLTFREIERYSESISTLDLAADWAGGDSLLKARILVARAHSEYLDRKYRSATDTLKEVDPMLLGPLDRSRFFVLRARVLLARDYFIESARDMIEAARSNPDESSRSMSVMEDALAGIESVEDLKSLQQSAEVTPFGELILYRVGERLLEIERFDEAQSVFRNYLVRYPRSARNGEVRNILNRRKQGMVVDSRIVGVLVPKSGKWASIGERVLKAIEMGIPSNTRKLIPVVEDSGETPEQLLSALDRLIFERRAMAVLGPVTTKGIAQAAQRAQETGVPMVTLSRKEVPDYDFVFQAGLTLELQIRTMVSKAMGELGFKRFAVLFPSDALGRLGADVFWDEVESRGGTIQAIESYAPEETDFRDVIDQLTGVAWSTAKKPVPTIDFDAVFIPDSAAVAARIFPAFRFRDIDDMNFLGLSVWNSADFVKRVGAGAPPKPQSSPSPSPSPTPSPALAAKGKKGAKGGKGNPAPSPSPSAEVYSATEEEGGGDAGAMKVAPPANAEAAQENAPSEVPEVVVQPTSNRKPEHRYYFVDTFSATSMSSSLRRFMDLFKKQTKFDASSLEVQSLDSTRILFQAIDGLGPDPSRDDLQNALTKVNEAEGLSGSLKYRDGYLIGEPRLLTVSKGSILSVKGKSE